MFRECSPLELRARLAILSAPTTGLAESAFAKALGRSTRSERDALLAKLAAENLITIEPARRGRRLRPASRAACVATDLRVPARARFSGAIVNALLAALACPDQPSTLVAAASVRDRLLAAHDKLARGPGGTVALHALRAELPDIERTTLDRALLELDREGLVALGRPTDLSALDPEIELAAIEDPLRGSLVYASRVPSMIETKP